MKCPICGEEIKEWDEKGFLERGMCSTCQFWKDHLIEDAKEPPHRVVMIDGHHYYIGDENSKETYFRGFGGHRFQIEFNDGFKVITTNLWYQGEPTAPWKDKFPNNAKFENNLKWKQVGVSICLIEDPEKEKVLPF